MRILILTFYFEPDLCACSFRMGPFVKALAAAAPADTEIDVVTTLPNRYQSFSQDAPESEQRENVRIDRIRIPRHKSGLLDQSLAFTRFAFAASRKIQGREYDLVFATSSRLFTAVLGALVARWKRAPLYLDIRDIFADTMKEVLPGRLARPASPILELLERATFRSACHINLVSEGFGPYFRERYPEKQFSFVSNGIDDAFLADNFQKEENGAGPATILYAGNIGAGQGLERIIPRAAELLGEEFKFQIIGDGGTRKKLVDAIEQLGVRNVKILPPVGRRELMAYYRRADYLFLHLNDFEAFKKVLPSKIFEYAATGKPLLAGVGGYSRKFIRENVENAEPFDPCDPQGLVDGLKRLQAGHTPREIFIDRFQRRKLMAVLADSVLDCLPQRTLTERNQLPTLRDIDR
jgi:glycosyltransferase involved in cell wall biosynthesis